MVPWLARVLSGDVGRVLDLPYSLCDTIANVMIPGDLGMTLDKALTMNRILKRNPQ